MIRLALAVVAAFVATAAAAPPGLHDAIEQIRTKDKVPAVGILVSERGTVVFEDAFGEARPGTNWHIGSDTKAMTATLIARAIEAKTLLKNGSPLAWTSTIADCAPVLAAKIDERYRGITVEQLLTHSSGIVDPLGPAWLGDMRKLEADVLLSSRDRRDQTIAKVLLTPPTAKPGEKYAYSNLNYIIAGHLLEAVEGRDWEMLIRADLFDKLGMKSPAFGLPQHLQGHNAAGNAVDVDNPATLGPAGTVNLTLDDWLKFCEVHAGHGTKDFLSADSLKRLHTPVLNDYAMGWIVVPGADGTPVLTHDGSNTFWYARAIIRPSDDRVLLITLNNADRKACDEITLAAVNALFSAAPKK